MKNPFKSALFFGHPRARIARHLLPGLILSLAVSAPRAPAANESPSPATGPNKGQLLAQARKCRDILRASLIQFYLPACVDEVNGGYKESLRDGQFTLTGEKFLTLQARQMWFFSTLATENYEADRALAAARSGFRFIEKNMRDAKNGGYFSKVTDEGGPRDPRKHIYLNSFALYGLCAYYQASKEPAALQAAQDLFRVLEDKAHDKQHGGYVEFFEADWRPITDAKAPGYVGAIGHKTYNTHLHLMESFAALYRIWPDELVGRRLSELMMINAHTVRFPTVNNNVDAYRADWTVVNDPKNLRASYGHDIECVWLIMDAAQALHLSPALFRNWAEGLSRTCLDFGYDGEHGGFYSSGPLGLAADDTKKIWWVQAEALVGLLELFRLTGEEKYYAAFSRTLDFCERYQVANAGSWWASRNADGSANNDAQRSGPWQGAYHAGRALILCSKWLEALAGK